METSMPNDKLFRRCIEPDCGGEFYITAKDQAFFAARGLELPRRCYKCRKKNKEHADRQLAQAPEKDPAKWEEVWSDKPKKH